MRRWRYRQGERESGRAVLDGVFSNLGFSNLGSSTLAAFNAADTIGPVSIAGDW